MTDGLQRYRQRDLIPSHIYRLGTKLFRSEPTRRRVIEAAHYVPRELVPHAANLRRTWDGRPLDTVHGARPQKSPVLQRRHSEQNLNAVDASDFTQAQYRQWMEERRRVRDGLEAMAISERWLCSKTRSPLENKVLAELRCKRREAITASVPIPTTQSEEAVTASSDDTKGDGVSRQSAVRHRRNTIRDAKALAAHLTHGKQRFITLLALHDPTGIGCIGTEELMRIIQKMKPPISQESLELILKSLPEAERGKLDYHPLIKGDIAERVKQYIDSSESCSFVQASPDHSGAEMSSKLQQSTEETECDTAHTVCTMGGRKGPLSTAHKEEEKRQFDVLLEFCQERGMILNKELVERALLLPSDHPRESCLAALRQPGLDLLSREFTAPPREAAKTVEKRDIGKRFGWAYKELKGKQKPTRIKIPKLTEQTSSSDGAGVHVRKAMLKRVTVSPKVDCWLSFKEYQKFARNVTSRPGFNYKYHGLPENNAFWPGALVEKLRLWLPSETLEHKPYSLYNIFQPVTHPRIYNLHAPLVEQRRAWPENAQGHVQFGGDSRKSYGL